MSEYSMLPAKPWLPRPWNLPFQPSSGSHTSKLICPGPIVPWTRQNAGSCGEATSDEQGGATLPNGDGPAPISWTDVILVSGSFKFARSAHGICGVKSSALAGAGANIEITSKTVSATQRSK